MTNITLNKKERTSLREALEKSSTRFGNIQIHDILDMLEDVCHITDWQTKQALQRELEERGVI